MKPKRYIRLLFNANKTYDRQVIEGVGRYLNATQCNWDLFIEDDFHTQADSLENWSGDGVIADFDNPLIEEKIRQLDFPTVAIGGSYEDEEAYPPYPYVATDNFKVTKLAFDHLRSLGLENFAFYGLKYSEHTRWAQQRKLAFNKIMEKEGYQPHVFESSSTTLNHWQEDQQELEQWLQQLPQPIGIIAVTDSRAHYLLQACEKLNMLIPERIAVIGIDNEEVARYITNTSLSSVEQGCQQMGYQAAKYLDQWLEGRSNMTPPPRLMIPPVQVHVRQSSDFHALKDPYVVQAMHYIRRHACQGIKVEQVLDYMGISRSNLEARFKEERHHSIHIEIHYFKLRQACDLLRSTDLPISQIADYCGYPSQQYMYAVFRKSFHCTPKAYREQYFNKHAQAESSIEEESMNEASG